MTEGRRHQGHVETPAGRGPDCERFEAALADLLGGESEGSAERSLRAHAGACPACGAEARALEGLLAELGHLPLPEPRPEDESRFLPELRARLRGREDATELPRGAPSWLALAAAVALAFLALAALFPPAAAPVPAAVARTAVKPIEDLARTHALARAIDPFDDGGLFAASAEPGAGELAASAPSGKVFALFEDLATLTEEEAAAWLDDTEPSSPGTGGSG